MNIQCAARAKPPRALNLRQGGHEELKERLQKKIKNKIQNRSRNHENSSPRGCPGALWRPPGWSWGLWGALLEISGAIWRRFLAKLGRRWSQDGRKMGQVGSKLRPRWAMMAPRWPSWAQFGSFWGGPGSIFGYFFREHWKNG